MQHAFEQHSSDQSWSCLALQQLTQKLGHAGITSRAGVLGTSAALSRTWPLSEVARMKGDLPPSSGFRPRSVSMPVPLLFHWQPQTQRLSRLAAANPWCCRQALQCLTKWINKARGLVSEDQSKILESCDHACVWLSSLSRRAHLPVSLHHMHSSSGLEQDVVRADVHLQDHAQDFHTGDPQLYCCATATWKTHCMKPIDSLPNVCLAETVSKGSQLVRDNVAPGSSVSMSRTCLGFLRLLGIILIIFHFRWCCFAGLPKCYRTERVASWYAKSPWLC